MTLFGLTPHDHYRKHTALASSTIIPLRLRSEVVFGTPSKNCSGNGICMLTQHRSAHPLVSLCPKSLAWFSMDLEARLIFLEFEWSELSREIQDKYFFQSIFLMEESVKVPLLITKKWGIRSDIQLNRGLHVVFRHGNNITVIFNY